MLNVKEAIGLTLVPVVVVYSGEFFFGLMLNIKILFEQSNILTDIMHLFFNILKF